jgi:predicted pyridoxine 5'-phosphate oxidase superfamily flavin-nucleotide-binding protein
MLENYSPWHAGERALHQQLGITEKMEAVGQRAIRNFMPDQHREFFSQLPFILAGSTDAAGQIWASMLTGAPGFISSPSPTELDIHAMPMEGDPLAEAIAPGRSFGMLGIELPTRRRNRANGKITTAGKSGFSFAVEQSFGNCPKYIVRRAYAAGEGLTSEFAAPKVELLSKLDANARALIANASTFFVASSAGPASLSDVSHRGGLPGFVTITNDTLTIPDYSGNFFFNTFGNLLVNPFAGLLFPDFDTGDLLQLTGETVLIEDESTKAFTPGAGSSWRFHPTAGRWLHGAMQLRFSKGEMSPFSPQLSPN